MKFNIYILFFFFTTTLTSAQTFQTFHDFSAIKINGDTLHFADLAGSKVLVVNTASYCSYTPQYADLEQLYQQYGGSSFTILGFPCNDFGGQEPHGNSEIDSFCTNTYNVTFQMMQKISITAPDTAEVYKWLQLQSLNGVADAPVLWNFQKFMIDEAGHWHDYALTAISPLDTVITNWITSPSVLNIPDQNSSISKITIYPNPVSDLAYISFAMQDHSNVNIQLLSKEGVLIKTIYNGINLPRNQIPLDVKALSSGIYLLRIITSDSMQMLKIAVTN